MTNKEAFNKIQHHINGTKLSGEEYIKCCEQIINSFERLEKLEKIISGIKKYPIIINESVRYDSAWGVEQMLSVSMDKAREIKEIYYLIKEEIQ